MRLLLCLILISPLSYAEEVYYCIDELATGTFLDEDSGKWSTGRFNGKRRTISFSDDRSLVRGIEEWGFTCRQHYSPNPHRLWCANIPAPGSPSTQFLMINMKNMRYEYSDLSPHGYQQPNSEYAENSIIYAGTCERF